MALSTIKNGEKITAPDNAVNTVEFGVAVQKPAPIATWWIEVISGSIQFAADEPVVGAHHVWGAGSKIPMTVHNTLYYKGQTGTGEAFVVTV